MGRVKPINCYRNLGGCGSICIEVGHAICYPKGLCDGLKFRGYEYRFLCPRCGKEYIYDTSDRSIFRVPRGSQFTIKLIDGKEFIKINAGHPGYEYTMRLLGLKPKKKGIILSPKEFKRLWQKHFDADRS